MRESVRKYLNNPWLVLLAGFLAIEIISFASFGDAWLSRLAYVAVIVLAFFLTWRKTEYGAYLLLSELIVGGLGYLISYPLDQGSRISLRMGLFFAVFSAVIIKNFNPSGWKLLKEKIRDKRLIALAVFFALFIIAAVSGVIGGHPISAVFADLNGYLYFGLILVFLSASLKPKTLLKILLAGSIVLALKTIVILFIFSHGYASVGTDFIYRWIRDTGVGEITLISYPLYRIFFQSQIFNLLALIFSAYLMLSSKNVLIDGVKRPIMDSLGLWLIAWLNFFVIVISQSRSFWVAGLLTFAVIIPALLYYNQKSWRKILACWLIIPIFAITANFAGQIVINNYNVDFFSGRVSGSAGAPAVSSRMAELQPAFELIRQAPLLGQGFGATIRFRSDDPRIKNQSNPEGWIDAPAIEWGYLDLAVKTGLLGLAAYLSFLLYLVWSLWVKARNNDHLAGLMLIGLLTLMTVHMFTPYLNHPLGIGYLLVILALIKKPA